MEDEIKALRLQNKELADHAGVSQSQLFETTALLPPSVPGSAADLKEDEEPVSDGAGSLVFKQNLKNKTPRRGTFAPNPQAPSWSPSESTQKKGARVGVKPHGGGAPLRPPSSATKAEPSNRGLQNMSLVKASNPKPGVAAKEPEVWYVEDVKKALEHLYEMVKGTIVNIYKDGTPRVPDNQLSTREPATWHYLTELVNPGNPRHGTSHMKYLLSAQTYRRYILKRVILDYLFKKIFNPNVFFGFDPETDQRLLALQEEMSKLASKLIFCLIPRDSVPLSVLCYFVVFLLLLTNHHAIEENPRLTARQRQRTVAEHGRLIRLIVNHEKGNQFRSEQVQSHAKLLAAILRPMRNNTVSEEANLVALRIVINNAWNTMAKVWSSDMTLHWTFPKCGDKFSQATMECHNQVHLDRTPEALQSAQYRISLVVGPNVSLRDDRVDPILKSYSIRKAEILAMK